MSDGGIFAVFAVCITALVIIVGFIGNKIVNKGSDAIRNKMAKKRSMEKPSDPVKLSDRFEKGRDL